MQTQQSEQADKRWKRASWQKADELTEEPLWEGGVELSGAVRRDAVQRMLRTLRHKRTGYPRMRMADAHPCLA